jgi:hypothetical protein
MKLQTKFFGEIEFSRGCFDYYGTHTILLDNEEKDVCLSIIEGLSDGNAETFAAMLDSAPELYAKGRKALLDGRETNELIKDFIEFHLEEIDTLHEMFGVDSNSEITPEMFIEKLKLTAISFRTAKNEPFECALDFMISRECSDEILVVIFNETCEVVNISHES